MNTTTPSPAIGSATLTSQLVTSAGEEDNAPGNYLSDDQRLTSFVEFQLATWIDNIYAPLCSGLGITGNLVSIWVLLMSPKLSGASTSVYLSALCFSDSLVQVVNILFLARKFPGHETLRHGTCGLVYFLLYFSIHYSVIVMMGMTLERYLAIRFPLKVGGWCTPRRARVVVGVMCLVTFLINVQHLFIRKMIWNDVLEVDTCTVSVVDQFYAFRVWVWIDSVLYCYLPFSSLAVLNVLIIRYMTSAAQFRGTSASSDKNDVSRQVTLMLLLVTCAFLLLVGPIAVLLVVERYFWIRTTVHEQAVYHLVRTIFNNLAYTNHAINFCLYCLGGNRFRQEFVRIFCPCLTGRAAASNTTQTTTSTVGPST